jgi:tRNA nucleotidyltransferase (CCA-adding enzyme)
MIFGRYKVTLSDTRLKGTMWGETVDQVKHSPACEPKGATFTALRVAQEPDGTWSAGCIIDV